MKLNGRYLCDACLGPCELAYVGTSLRDLCESCTQDVWAGLRIRGKLTRIQRLQPPNASSERPAILPPVESD